MAGCQGESTARAGYQGESKATVGRHRPPPKGRAAEEHGNKQWAAGAKLQPGGTRRAPSKDKARRWAAANTKHGRRPRARAASK